MLLDHFFLQLWILKEYVYDSLLSFHLWRRYPALITAYDEEAEEAPYTLTFENGDTEQAKLPDPDMVLRPY